VNFVRVAPVEAVASAARTSVFFPPPSELFFSYPSIERKGVIKHRKINLNLVSYFKYYVVEVCHCDLTYRPISQYENTNMNMCVQERKRAVELTGMGSFASIKYPKYTTDYGTFLS
jgi:hypothetical protein